MNKTVVMLVTVYINATLHGRAGILQHGFKRSPVELRNFLFFRRSVGFRRVFTVALFTHVVDIKYDIDNLNCSNRLLPLNFYHIIPRFAVNTQTVQ